jgi:hypothetical protein
LTPWCGELAAAFSPLSEEMLIVCARCRNRIREQQLESVGKTTVFDLDRPYLVT